MMWRTVGLRQFAVLGIAAALAACGSAYVPAPTPEPPAPLQAQCQPIDTNEPLVGNWLSKHSEPGVMGEFRTLFTLKANGQMLYNEQLKRPRQPSQGISESGCWWRDANRLVLKTLRSNGVDVDESDPIYTNYYTIVHSNAERLGLRSAEGAAYSTERVSPGFRLPF